jgi:hypothetical protein
MILILFYLQFFLISPAPPKNGGQQCRSTMAARALIGTFLTSFLILGLQGHEHPNYR